MRSRRWTNSDGFAAVVVTLLVANAFATVLETLPEVSRHEDTLRAFFGLSRASLHTGDDVAVVYDPENEWRTYRDTLPGVWWAPMLVWGGQIATFLGSLTEGVRERRTA